MKLTNKHLFSGDELSADEIFAVIKLAQQLKTDRLKFKDVLKHKYLALMFDKPSLRTRFSFTIAMQELGGEVIISEQANRKDEDPEDYIRVLQGYCHAVMLRTFADEIFVRMQKHATIPIINGLSNLYHPCQTLADLMTLHDHFGQLNGLSLCYIGDGNNVLHSLLLMAPKLGIEIHYCCPEGATPNKEVLQHVAQYQKVNSAIAAHASPETAVKNCDVVYTDVWTSMGFTPKDEQQFSGFQVNEKLMSKAKNSAVFMHCMPMNRGKEVSETLPDQPYSKIFEQSENRLHVQKALLLNLLA